MQAIRVLRANSRPASPAPSLEGNGMSAANGVRNATEDIQQPQRPNSAMSRIQSLTPFHKRVVFTPPPSPKPTAANAQVVVQSAIVQDGAYLNTLGLKLNEAATRVLMATPGGNGSDVWKGKRPLQSGRGRQFASLVETELDASQGNTNLRHAIIRLLPRSLHMIVSSLSNQVSQLIAIPGYSPPSVTSALHPSTIHALALAVFTGEILETFHAYKLDKASSDLAAIQGHLDTIISRITTPLFTQAQSEMVALLEPIGQSPTSVSLGVTASPAPHGKPGKPHPAVLALGQNMPHFLKALKRCVIPSSQVTQDALAKVLIGTIWQALVQLSHRAPPISNSIISPNSGAGSNTSTLSTSTASTLANTMAHKASTISLALSQISLTPPSSPPNAAGSGKKQLKPTPPSSPPAIGGKKKLADSPRTGGMLRLRRVPSAGSSGSRSSSPDTRAAAAASQTVVQQQQAQIQALSSAAWLNALATDTKAVGEMLTNPDVPRPVIGSLARDAVEEGFERFVAFKEWIVAGAVSASSAAGIHGAKTMSSTVNGSNVTTLQKLMDSAPEEVPWLILLPVLLGQAWVIRPQLHGPTSPANIPATGEKDSESTLALASTTYPGVARLIGYESDDTYRRGVLCGFRRAEECEVAIARCLLGRLGTAGTGSGSAWARADGVTAWLAQRAE